MNLKLHYVHNYVRRARYKMSSPDSLPTGRHQLRFEFEPTGKPDLPNGGGTPGHAQLYVDGQPVGQEEFPVTTPVVFHPGGLTCGANPGSPVTPDYQAPLTFTGTLHTVTVDLSVTSSPTPKPRCAWPWPASKVPGSDAVHAAGLVPGVPAPGSRPSCAVAAGSFTRLERWNPPRNPMRWDLTVNGA